MWQVSISWLTLVSEGSPQRGSHELEEEAMNTKRSVAMKTFALVVAALFSVGVAAVPADAASTTSSAAKVRPMDSGWTFR